MSITTVKWYPYPRLFRSNSAASSTQSVAKTGHTNLDNLVKALSVIGERSPLKTDEVKQQVSQAISWINASSLKSSDKAKIASKLDQLRNRATLSNAKLRIIGFVGDPTVSPIGYNGPRLLNSERIPNVNKKSLQYILYVDEEGKTKALSLDGSHQKIEVKNLNLVHSAKNLAGLAQFLLGNTHGTSVLADSSTKVHNASAEKIYEAFGLSADTHTLLRRAANTDELKQELHDYFKQQGTGHYTVSFKTLNNVNNLQEVKRENPNQRIVLDASKLEHFQIKILKKKLAEWESKRLSPVDAVLFSPDPNTGGAGIALIRKSITKEVPATPGGGTVLHVGRDVVKDDSRPLRKDGVTYIPLKAEDEIDLHNAGSPNVQALLTTALLLSPELFQHSKSVAWTLIDFFKRKVFGKSSESTQSKSKVSSHQTNKSDPLKELVESLSNVSDSKPVASRKVNNLKKETIAFFKQKGLIGRDGKPNLDAIRAQASRNRLLTDGFGLVLHVHTDLNAFGNPIDAAEAFVQLVSATPESVIQSAILDHFGAKETHRVLQGGVGFTGAFNKYLIRLHQHFKSQKIDSNKIVYGFSQFEHHSNSVLFRKHVPDTVEGHKRLQQIQANQEGLITSHEILAFLESNKENLRSDGNGAIVLSLTLQSNVTSIKIRPEDIRDAVDTFRINNPDCDLNRLYISLDAAAYAPHKTIKLSDYKKPGGQGLFDAIAFSPYKLDGGQGGAGVAVVSNRVLEGLSLPPASDAANEPLLRTAVGLVLVGVLEKQIEEVEKAHTAKAFRELRKYESPDQNTRIRILGPDYNSDRRGNTLPIIIERKDPNGGWVQVDPHLVTHLMQNYFGIATRAGCNCAGPYGHLLQGQTGFVADVLNQYVTGPGITSVQKLVRPGWNRSTLGVMLSDESVDYFINAYKNVVDNFEAYAYTADYHYQDGKLINPETEKLTIHSDLDGDSDSYQFKALSIRLYRSIQSTKKNLDSRLNAVKAHIEAVKVHIKNHPKGTLNNSSSQVLSSSNTQDTKGDDESNTQSESSQSIDTLSSNTRGENVAHESDSYDIETQSESGQLSDISLDFKGKIEVVDFTLKANRLFEQELGKAYNRLQTQDQKDAAIVDIRRYLTHKEVNDKIDTRLEGIIGIGEVNQDNR